MSEPTEAWDAYFDSLASGQVVATGWVEKLTAEGALGKRRVPPRPRRKTLARGKTKKAYLLKGEDFRRR